MLRRFVFPLRLLACLLVLASPEAVVAASPPAPAVIVSNGPRSVKEIALTFDDGLGTAACSAVVDLLEALQTPATFFPNARWAAGSPELWHRIASLGFPVGNHTVHHLDLRGRPFAVQLAEIADNVTAMEKATGAPLVPLFRPPYGSYDATTIRAATAAGVRYVVLWDTTVADTSRRRNGQPWPVEPYVRSATRGTNGSIILGHCGEPIEQQVLPLVVADYRARGFTFVTVPQLLAMPGARAMTFPSSMPAPSGAAPSAAPSAPAASAPAASAPASAQPSAPPPTAAASPAPSQAPSASGDLAAAAQAPAAIGAVIALAIVALGLASVARRRRGARTEG